MSKKQRYPYTLSSVLLDALINTDTPYLFGVAGSAERDFYDTLARNEYTDKITFIQGNSEYPAARMSLGYARASEKVSPLIMHVQLGPANAALAVLDAKISKIPLFIFTVGHISTANDYREALYGYYRTPELLREYCKYVYRIGAGVNADRIIQRALRLAGTPPAGPVFLTVAQDIIETPLHKKQLKKARFSSPSAPDNIIRKLSTAMKKAEKPVIITQRTKNKDSISSLVKIAETLGAAVFEMRPCYMNFPCSHPLHQGFFSDSASMMKQYLQSSDLVLTLDCFYPPEIDTGLYIQVSDNPLAFNENADHTIFSTTEAFLQGLLRNLGNISQHTDRIDVLQSRHEIIRTEWMNLLKQRFNDDPPSPQRIWFEINQVFNHGQEHIIFFAPAFTQRLSVLRYLERDVPGCYYSALSAAMGSAGEAIGVQLAEQRRVLCVLGDFEAHMAQLPTLLWTCAHHNIPVIWIVLDNATGATVKRAFWMYGQYSRDTRTFVGVDLDKPRTDWVQIAEANSVTALRCERGDEVQSCLSSAVSMTSPVLISVKTQAFEDYPEGYLSN
ncbi:MAG: thiamine pyrophosphate-binding protein [Candidatus Bathyarchaeota archaeon]|nr:thiamine pyrophosphate-binding protein [Candidatus Bathyarchaeota archaeon]